jgi:cytoskeletal protein RodZ
MIEFLKRHRVIRALLGGTAVVGAGAAMGQAAIGHDSSTPPKKVPLGQPTNIDVEGTRVEVPPTSDVPAPAPMPPDTLDHPQANAAAENSPTTPNTTANTPHVNTTANTANVNTTANTANTVSAEVEHRGRDRFGDEGGDHHGPAPAGHDGGGDHSGPGPSGHDGGDHSGSDGGSDHGGSGGGGGGRD